MKRAPTIGQRVRYRAVTEWGQERVATGVVTKLYPKNDDVFDDDGEFVRFGPPLPESAWHACIKVDERPHWWPYPDTDLFAPEVRFLTALAKVAP